MKIMKFKVPLTVCSILMIFALCSSAWASTTFISIGTGGTGGVYFPLGGALANIITNNMPGYSCTAESTGGSVENTMLISRNQVELAFIDASTVYNAQNNLAFFADQNVTNLRGLVSLFPEAVQLVTLDPTIRTIEDLRGRRVAVGSPGSGTETMTRDILSLYGMTYDDIRHDFLGFADASAGLRDGTIDAAIIWAGVPTAGIMELGTMHNINLLSFSDETFERLQKIRPVAIRMTITNEHYSSLEEEVSTFAIPATLAAQAELSEEFVYNLLTVFFDNLDTFAAAHVRGGDVSLETALQGMEYIELHPGAIKFYRARGLLE